MKKDTAVIFISLIALIGAAIAVIAMVSMTIDRQPANTKNENAVNEETKKMVRANMYAGCTENGTDSKYCTCVANNFTAGLDKARLATLIELEDKGNQTELVDFMSRYAMTCE